MLIISCFVCLCVQACVINYTSCIHNFPVQETNRKRESNRFMNGQQGSDLAAGAGTDMLTAEGRGGAVRCFRQKKSRNAW